MVKNGKHNIFLFDLDQTLLNFHASEYIGLKIVLEESGLSFTDEIYEAFRAYNQELWHELERGSITRTELFLKRFRYIFSLCEGDSSGLDPLEVNDRFIRTMSVNGVLMDGALEFVKRLKEEIPDSKIYIASNGATINAKGRIKSTGLEQYLDGLFISEDMGITKPDPAFFEYIVRMIGADKENCIMVGDSLSSDMLGAKNASLTSVWFTPSGNRTERLSEIMQEYRIDHVAETYGELLEVLKAWSCSE